MGTNYYLHLGKRSSIGQGCSFTWATPPPGSSQRPTAWPWPIPPTITVIDEYGCEQSLGEFFELVNEDEQRLERIGQRFS